MGLPTRAIAIIPAAGSGERMRLSESKLLCQVDGQSVIAKTLSVFSKSGLFSSLLVPCRESDRETFIQATIHLETPLEFFTGGASRQESVRIALQRIHNSDISKENLIVLVHDAARCFVSKQLIERSLLAANQSKAVSAAIPCVDTVYQSDESGCILNPLLERANLRSIQTPQAFDFNLLWQAHNATSLRASSDDAGLVASIHKVTLIEGEISNYKITTVEDLERARAIRG